MNHNFKRIENQTDWDLNKKSTSHFWYVGAVWEGVKSSRYDSEKLRKQNDIQYAFTPMGMEAIGKIYFDWRSKI